MASRKGYHIESPAEVATTDLKKRLVGAQEKRRNAVNAVAAARDEEESILKLMREERAKIIVERVDALLALVPDHSRTSCSDQNIDTMHARCARCVLVEAKRSGWIDPNISVRISVEEEGTDRDNEE